MKKSDATPDEARNGIPEVLRRFVLNSHSDAMVVGREFSLLFWNDQFARLFGLNEQHRAGQLTLADIFTPDSLTIARERLDSRLAAHPPEHPAVFECRSLDGTVFSAEFSVLSWPSDPGLTIAMVRDLRQRHQWLEELFRSERLYRTLAESIPAGVVIADSACSRRFVNRKACEITGYSAEELLSGLDLLHPDEVECRIVREKAYRDLTPGSYPEARYMRKDGSTVWVSISWSPFVDDSGKPAGLCVIFSDITEQKLARSAAKSAESVYRILAESIPAGVLIADREGRNVYANARAAEITGYSVDELLSGVWLLHPDEKEAQNLHSRVFHDLTSRRGYQTRFVRKDGSTIWVVVSWDVVRGEDGDVEAVCSVFTDITDYKLAELAARTAETSYASLAEAAADIVWQMDLQGRFTYVSSSVAHYGYTREDWVGHHLSEFLPERERVIFEERFARDVANPGARRHEVEMLCKDGSTVWMDVSVDYVMENGKPVRLIGIARDITRRRQAEQAHRESEERFESLVRNIPGAVYRCALDELWTMRFLSDAITDICGYPASDFIDNRVRSFADIIHPDDRQRLFDLISTEVAEGRPYQVEYRILHADGTERCVVDRGRGIQAGSGGVLWLDGVILDITDLMRTMAALEESEERYRNIVENASEMIMLTRADGVITYLSPRCREITGYDPEELVGRMVSLAPPEDREASFERMKRALAGEPGKDFETRIVTRSGQIKWLSHSWAPIIRNGKVQMVVSVVSDITHIREAEEARRIAHENLQKAFELQRQFLHGVTHEVRTPLTTIQGYARMFLDGTLGKLTDAQTCAMRSMLRSSEDLLETVEGVLEVARLKSGIVALNPVACKPCEVVAGVAQSYRKEAERLGLQLEIDCSDLCEMGLYDRSKLEIILRGLLSNALKFTPKGEIRVIAECPGRGLSVVVADTGIGISGKNLGQIFDEFAQFDDPKRQKPQGFGLGLAVVAALVDALGGSLAVSSARSVGTAFTVYLPEIADA